jgi:hypothetical protein
MSTVFDFHTHIFPGQDRAPLVSELRKRTRQWSRPFVSSLHGMHLLSRLLPENARRVVDQVGTLMPLANLLVESTVNDLLEGMKDAGVDHALVIAQPPRIPNEFVLEVANAHPRLHAAVSIPSGTAEPGKVLRDHARRGARVLKIHTAADGEGVNSPRYRELLDVAAELGLPVVLHTGCMHSNVLFKDSTLSRAEVFRPWFKLYSKTKFVLAHMNLHEPTVALELAEDFENVLVDTSWQPTEIIGEAVRRAGAERVLFGTDWPIVGNNLAIGKARIEACFAKGTLTERERDLVLGGNALKLLGMLGGDLHAEGARDGA